MTYTSKEIYKNPPRYIHHLIKGDYRIKRPIKHSRAYYKARTLLIGWRFHQIKKITAISTDPFVYQKRYVYNFYVKDTCSEWFVGIIKDCCGHFTHIERNFPEIIFDIDEYQTEFIRTSGGMIDPLQIIIDVRIFPLNPPDEMLRSRY